MVDVRLAGGHTPCLFYNDNYEANMLATIASATLLGVDGRSVWVEVHVSKTGLPRFVMVGLPDAACRESRDRIRAAIINAGLTFAGVDVVTVNLAPSGLRKSGSALDLPIAIAYLVASGQLDQSAVENVGLLGELGLDGTIRGVRGALPLVEATEAKRVVVPAENAAEAQLSDREVLVGTTLADVVAALAGEQYWPDPPELVVPTVAPGPDMSEVRGHRLARKAMEVAAGGGHHLLMLGPPGSGKTMLAQRSIGLLPSLDDERGAQVIRVHSAAGSLFGSGGPGAGPAGAGPLRRGGDGELVVSAPFRAPHHTATVVSLVGGGSTQMRPGEVSLAHGGVLFLDELAEFPAHALDALRQPLEDGTIRVSRAHASVSFPARCLLVAAMNPCPCGSGTPERCRCSEPALRRYARRISGPLLDRFDLRVRVEGMAPDQLVDAPPGESSAAVAERVARAREAARDRGVSANRELSLDSLEEHTRLTPEARTVLDSALRSGRLSGRGMARLRAVALTLRDLDGADGTLDAATMQVALGLRAEVGVALAAVA